ncbi:MAG: PGDYG domain-containing protein [Candidatus Colwellbacteria bacterium]|nr:PGDYG domain-containing protein [Candidatus Colwellbacteria bacterium]
MFIEQKSPEIRNALDKAPIYRKRVTVKARKAIAGEEITTFFNDGAGITKETENTAEEGDWIVTSPLGEIYIVKEKIFNDSYRAIGEDGTYKARKFCRAIVNPYGGPVKIMASWGSYQSGGSNCYIIDSCDEEGKRDSSPYIVAAEAFDATYELVEDFDKK